MTYKEAYDKIIQAYFKDEIKPLLSQFCFCGTLSNGSYWRDGDANYTSFNYINMESALLRRTELCPSIINEDGLFEHEKTRKYEDALFAGMCAALDVLKEIHRSRGEDVDETLTLTKRNLQTH